MTKKLICIAALLLVALTLSAQMVGNYCPLHTYAVCHWTGQISTTGSGAKLYSCSCGDNVWVP